MRGDMVDRVRSWNRVLQSALSGLLVGLLASGPALAQQPAVHLLPRVVPSAAAPALTVLVVPLDAAAEAQLVRLTYQAEQAVAASQRFELVRLADALDAQGSQERVAKATEAAAALQEGQKAYDELDTQKALQQFDKAAQLYEGSDLSRHFMDMSRARVMKIAAYVANGDNKAFQRELKEVLARDPRAEFSSNFFPADELAAVEKVRRGILNEATRTLEVKTGGVPAQIFVDGQFRGISPMTLSDQTAAEHFVTAIAPGYALAQGRFRGEASLTLQPLPSQPRLKDWTSRAAAAPEGADRDAALRELGTFVDAQQVLALLVRGTPSATGQDAIAVRVEVSDGHTPGYAEGPLPLSGAAGDTALQTLLASVLQTDAPRGKGGKPTKHYTGSQGGSSGRKTAGYVLLATGAALVAGGVYFGLEASSKADEFKKLPQTDPRAEKLRSDGKTYALVADVGVIAGIAAAGAGTWLAFLSGGGGDDSGASKKARAAPAPAARPETAPAAAKPEDKPAAPAATGKTQDKATPPPAAKPEDKPAAAPSTGADKPTAAPAAPQVKSTPASRAEEEKRKREEEKKRAEEEKLKRAEEEKLKREEEARRKQAEEDKRKEEERLKRESGDKKKQEEERLKREEEEKKKQEEERKKREEEEKKKREDEAKRKREEEEKRKREEEEKKKKKPALDEDDLRNY